MEIMLFVSGASVQYERSARYCLNSMGAKARIIVVNIYHTF